MPRLAALLLIIIAALALGTSGLAASLRLLGVQIGAWWTWEHIIVLLGCGFVSMLLAGLTIDNI